MTTHLNKQGNAQMVDVSSKGTTSRLAKAMAIITMNDLAYSHIKSGYIKKGDILGVSQVAGVMAAKNTSSIIPLCHPIALNHVDIEYRYDDSVNELFITSTVTDLLEI